MIAQDKQFHFVAGTVAAVFGILVWYGFVYLFRAPESAAPFAGVLAGLVAGFTKEVSDWLSNRAAIASGSVPTHGVEFFDALATALPGLLICGFWLSR